MSSLAVTGASLLILLPSIIFGVSVGTVPSTVGTVTTTKEAVTTTKEAVSTNSNTLSGEGIQQEYVEVTAEDGTAFATSEYDDEYAADKAFKIDPVDSWKSWSYWCSKIDAEKPVYLWFQYKEPKRVTDIKFEEKSNYRLPPGSIYEVFASNATGNCSDENSQTILFSGTQDLFYYGVELQNKHQFFCYGLKVQSQSDKGYVAVKRLMFGSDLLSKENVPLTLDGAEYFATSAKDTDRYGPQWAFKRETSRTFGPWLSSKGLPQTVHVRLPFRVTVSGLSFRSSRLMGANLMFPKKFDFIGSNDCESWTVIVQVSGVEYSDTDGKKSWSIPIKQRASYECYGIRVPENATNWNKVAIHDVKLWREFNMYEKVGLIDELMDKTPKNVITIAYEGNNVLDEKSQGKENTPTQVRYQPLSITMPKTKDGLFYTLIMIDPDTPSRDTPIKNKTQVLHWLMVNIPGHGFGGRHLAPYIGSGPPQETGIHRYTFLIFEEGKTPKDYKGIAPFDTVDVARRVYWNFVEHGKPWTLRGFMNWAKLGEPVAANFYQAQYANADVDVDDNL